ncbi:MAG: radical SAM protein [Fusobacterium sp.]|nr:radical SAM protein [Fusobacterium sp.]
MKNKKNIRYLVLWLADNCNLKCKYCYAQPVFTHELMSLETAKKAINLCKDKDFTLILAGGEPLLNFKVIEKLYQYLKENGYKCKIGLQSNGTLITDEIAEKLAAMEINIGISFDGTMAVNEELRGGTKKVLEGINLLREHKKNININCVLSNRNIDKLEKLVEMAYYLGNVKGIGLDLLRIAGNCSNNSDIFPPRDEEIYINLKKSYEKIKILAKLTGKKIGIREIEEIKLRECTICNNDNYCYSSLGQAMVVTPNGDTYPCSSLVGNMEYYMGNIDGEINMKQLSSGKYERCGMCEYKQVCKGCCPSRMLYNKKYEIEDKDCILRKAVFKLLEEERSINE